MDQATVADVARRAGVSRATAARALGGYGRVSTSTVAAVRRAAEEVGYRVNELARSMITGRTRTIGVVLSDIENQFFTIALRGITDVLREHGYDLLLANTDEDSEAERKAIQVMAGRQVEGLIVCPVDPDEVEHLAECVAAGRPVVLLDRTVTALRLDSVGIDNRRASREVVSGLIARGHRRIGMVSGVRPRVLARALQQDSLDPVAGETPSEGRLVGYCHALRDAGIPIDPALVVDGGFHRGQAHAAARRLLESPERPTAIVTTDSLHTLGALQAIRDLGLRCPEEISLLGFDDADWASLVEPPITVVSQPAYDIGARAAEFLLSRITDGGGEPRSVQLPTTLIERASVAAPPN